MKIAQNYPIYKVSEDGRVFNIKTGRELKQSLNPLTRYYEIRVYDRNSKPYKKNVHRIVAEAYLSRVEGKNQVNHKDSNRKNNHYTNLEWCTASENMQHAYDFGNKLPPWSGKFGKDNPKSKPVKSVNITTGEITNYESIACTRRAGYADQLVINCCKGIKKSYNRLYWFYL